MPNRLTNLARAIFETVMPNTYFEARRSLVARHYVDPEKDMSPLYVRRRLHKRRTAFEPVFDLEVRALFEHFTRGQAEPTYCLVLMRKDQNLTYDLNDRSIRPIHTISDITEERFYLTGKLSQRDVDHLSAIWNQGTPIREFLNRVEMMGGSKNKVSSIKALLEGSIRESELREMTLHLIPPDGGPT